MECMVYAGSTDQKNKEIIKHVVDLVFVENLSKLIKGLGCG